MIVKEYRIPMPFDVEEYRIAQLYMIAKKSKLESEGENSGVEIITNEPYADGPGGSGQYTEKNYYIGAHLPYWLQSFLPKSLSCVKEEAWNAYPYSMNKIFTPYMSKFSLEMESKYLIGGADQENVFNLSEKDLAQRTVDVVDFVSDKLTGGNYLESEDPEVYKSAKTKRGPLPVDWLAKTKARLAQSNNNNHSGDHDSSAMSDGSQENLMCVYKISRVRFEQWPLQSRVEQFIHDYIRKTLIDAHRQAWAWQDEWHGLTMTDIRQMEKETQECLAAKLKKKDSASS